MLWLELPLGWRTTAFCQAAQDRGVLVSSSEVFTTREGNAPQAVRIAVNAEYGLERYLEAIDVLADLLRNPDYVSVV
jgi:DNA-binding transcriptional MocR family regulator